MINWFRTVVFRSRNRLCWRCGDPLLMEHISGKRVCLMCDKRRWRKR